MSVLEREKRYAAAVLEKAAADLCAAGKALRPFDEIPITLSRQEWESLTKALRKHNAENPGTQLQLGRVPWMVVAAIEGACGNG